MRSFTRGSGVGPAAAFGLFGLWAAGQVMRDATPATALFFYLPSPLLLALLAAMAWRLRRRKTLAAACALLALTPAAVILFLENRWTPPPSSAQPAGELRLIHWNVARGMAGRAVLVRLLRRHQADVYVLSEVPAAIDEARFALELGDGYASRRLGSILVVAKGGIPRAARLVAERTLKVADVTCDLQRGRLRLLAVDVASDPTVARAPLLRRVISLMELHRPDLVVGDFNAPRLSRALTGLPGGFMHAYDAAGWGWSYTWPAPLPVLALDHCLLGERVVPLRYELHTTLASDHRQQLLTFALRPGR